MTTQTYQRRICDRCGDGADVAHDQPGGWVHVFIRDPLALGLSPSASGLTETDVPQHADLCPACRRRLAAWYLRGAGNEAAGSV